MKIHEYQAKEILAKFGIPIPAGKVATTAEQAQAIAAELGGRVVVKAQVYAGGRGKGGGVKLVNSPEEAGRAAGSLLGSRLVTHQTGTEGVPVNAVLVEAASGIAREIYIGIVIDSAAAAPVIMASEGGMDIEEIAAESPEKILRLHMDPLVGYQPYHGAQIADHLAVTGALVRPLGDLVGNLYKAFVAKDASLAEINPLIITDDNKVLALDAKLNFDDNAMFRQRDLPALRDPGQEDPMEVEASNSGISNYIKLSGTIGCVVNGAGLAMATLDTIKLFGGDAANFLDIGTVNSTDRVVGAFKLLTSDPDVKVIYFNIFGGMARVDVICQGIVEAVQTLNLQVPVVARLTGNAYDEGMEILKAAGVSLITASDTADGAQKAVAAIK